MSYLISPRLSFVGRFLSDVSTRNNVPENYRPSGPLTDHWNITGGSAFELLDCKVCSEPGLDATDPARTFTATGAIDRPGAKMVDLDPEWQMSSQIWGLQIRVADPATGELAVKGECAVSAFRDLWRRQFGDLSNEQPSGARFVTVMTELEWGPAAERSPVISRLRAETRDGRLSVGMHQFGYFYTQAHPRYRTGSLILHIGPSHAGEPETALVHRRIRSLVLNTGTGTLAGLGHIDFAVAEDGSKAFFDIGHALPIADVDGTLAGFGQVHPALAALSALSFGVAPTSAPPIGTPVPEDDLRPLLILTPDPGWYRRTGGVIATDVPTDLRDAVRSQPLALFGRFASGEWLLLSSETEDGIFLRADNFVQRLDSGEEREVRIHLRKWGKPLPGQTVHAARVRFGAGGSVEPDASARGLAIDPPAPTDIQGSTTLRLRAEDPGNPRAQNDLDGQIFTVAYSHKLDDSGLPKLDGTGLGPLDLVLAHVRDPFPVPASPEFHSHIRPLMAQYARLYPIMSRHLFDIADYDALVRNRQAMLLAFTRDIHDPNYMPVTRDLSEGKLVTLVKWLSTDTNDPDNPLRRDRTLAPSVALDIASLTTNAGPSTSLEDVKMKMAGVLLQMPQDEMLDLRKLGG